jgi:hypothetical protein
MSLVQCPDCQHEISRLAKACPKCGRPARTSDIRKLGFFLSLLVGAFILALIPETRIFAAILIALTLLAMLIALIMEPRK